jgi:aldehyde dehydrogenase family protein
MVSSLCDRVREHFHIEALGTRSAGHRPSSRADRKDWPTPWRRQSGDGAKPPVDALLDAPEVEAISFVGSSPVARYIYARSAADGKRVQCQGGAKNHVVVL